MTEPSKYTMPLSGADIDTAYLQYRIDNLEAGPPSVYAAGYNQGVIDTLHYVGKQDEICWQNGFAEAKRIYEPDIAKARCDGHDAARIGTQNVMQPEESNLEFFLGDGKKPVCRIKWDKGDELRDPSWVLDDDQSDTELETLLQGSGLIEKPEVTPSVTPVLTVRSERYFRHSSGGFEYEDDGDIVLVYRGDSASSGSQWLQPDGRSVNRFTGFDHDDWLQSQIDSGDYIECATLAEALRNGEPEPTPIYYGHHTGSFSDDTAYLVQEHDGAVYLVKRDGTRSHWGRADEMHYYIQPHGGWKVITQAEAHAVLDINQVKIEPTPEGWIAVPDTVTECPVDPDTEIQVRLCGENYPGHGYYTKAGGWHWNVPDALGRITHYKLKPEEIVTDNTSRYYRRTEKDTGYGQGQDYVKVDGPTGRYIRDDGALCEAWTGNHAQNDFDLLVNIGLWEEISVEDVPTPQPAPENVSEGRDSSPRSIEDQLRDRIEVLTDALEAVKARIEGEFDHPALVAYGPLLADKVLDIKCLVDQALDPV